MMLTKTSGWKPATARVARGGTIELLVIHSNLPEERHVHMMPSVMRSIAQPAGSVIFAMLGDFLKRWIGRQCNRQRLKSAKSEMI